MIVQSGIRRVAVVDETDRLVGVVAESDLVGALEPERGGLWEYLIRRLSRAQVRQRHPGLSQRAQNMTAAEIMTTDMVVARDAEPLGEAIARMVERGLKELPAVDGEGRFVGFLTRRAVMQAIARQVTARTGPAPSGPGGAAPQDASPPPG